MNTIPTFYEGPGLVDVQVNGYAGYDFNGNPDTWSVEDWFDVARSMAYRGVAAALPTFVTDSPARLIRRAEGYARLIREEPALASFFPGLHVEGPFVSPEDGPRGAHPHHWCTTPDARPDFFNRLVDATGDRLKMFTLAPELPGALRLIEKGSAAGVCMALGHTGADAAILDLAAQSGARLSTHLGNAAHPTLPRFDNYMMNQLADDRLYAGFIADGHHIPYPVLKSFLRAKEVDRAILVTDAIPAADRGPGAYILGEMTIIVDEDLRCTLPGATDLAGSALTLDCAVLNVSKYCGIPLEDAWKMASVNPARLIGLDTPPLVRVDILDERFETRRLPSTL